MNVASAGSVPAEVIVHDVIVLDGDRASFDPDAAHTWIAAAQGRIVAVGRGQGWKDLAASAQAEIVDGRGGYLAPAYIDMHCHGAGGSSAEEGRAGLADILAVHRAHGTRGLVLSYVSDTIDRLCRSLAEGAALVRENPAVLGLHAEGPFLSPDFKGAHSPEVLTTPTPEEVERILFAADGTLVQITLAPELPGALEAITRFTSAGVKVALGHTAADFDTTARAFDTGASILTHVFNGMPGIHHRAPGPILAAVEAGHVTLELINDGVHVVAPAVRMVRDLAPGRIALITDAMAATGMSDGRYMLGQLPVSVEDSVARLVTADGAPGSIAGSTLTMDAAVHRAVTEVGMNPLEAVEAASRVPLRALGLESTGGPGLDPECADDGSGSPLAPRKPADFLLLNRDMTVRTAWFAD